jgi:hypothetical protein
VVTLPAELPLISMILVEMLPKMNDFKVLTIAPDGD